MSASATTEDEPALSQLESLQAELQARISETEWLRTHYDAQLRSAFAQVAMLQSQLQEHLKVGLIPSASPSPNLEDLERLRSEVARLSAAEMRYLDRIEELKELLARDHRKDG